MEYTNQQKQLAHYYASIGNAYKKGTLLNKNHDKAFQYIKQAAAYNDGYGISLLATCYEEGIGTSINPLQALNYYEDAYEQNDIKATYKLGDYYWNGLTNILPVDRMKAYNLYLEALIRSKQENDTYNAPDIYFRLARCLQTGIGTQHDLEGAISFYQHAYNGFYQRIEEGDIKAETLLNESEQQIHNCQKDLGIQPIQEPIVFEA